MVSPVTVVSLLPLFYRFSSKHPWIIDHFIKTRYQLNSNWHCIWIHKCMTIFISYSSIARLWQPLPLLYVVYAWLLFFFKLCLYSLSLRIWQSTYSTLTSLFVINVYFCLCILESVILGITMSTWLWPACSCLLYLYKPCAMLSWIVLVYLCRDSTDR